LPRTTAANQIQAIAGLHNCKQLVELCISNNNLTTISGLEGLPLKTLRLNSNSLTKINGFESLSSLQYLDLSGNEVRTRASALNLEHVPCFGGRHRPLLCNHQQAGTVATKTSQVHPEWPCPALCLALTALALFDNGWARASSPTFCRSPAWMVSSILFS